MTERSVQRPMADKCVIYTRVSTKEQEAEGYSIDAQLKACRAFCQEHGYTVAAEFSEAESAGRVGRKRFTEMLAYLEANVDTRVVVAHKLDRLYRNFADPLALEQELEATVRCVIGDMPATPQGELSRNVQLAVSKFYLDNLSEEVKKGMDEKVAQGGWPHKAPIGYFNDKNTRSLVLDPARAPHVRHAYERYSTGTVSLAELSAELFSHGLTTRKGKRIATSALHKMLTSPIYHGALLYKGVVYPGIHEPIVSRELWDAAQSPREDRRRGKRKRTKHVYALRDWLYCAQCGCKITVEGQRGHNYYRCTHGKGREACSERAYTREEVLFGQVDEILARIEFPADLIEVLVEEAALLDAEASRDTGPMRRSLESKLGENRDRAARLLDAYLDGVVPETDYRAKVAKLEEERAGFEQRLSELAKGFVAKKDKVEALARTASGARALFDTADVHGKRKVLETVLLNAQIEGGKITSYQLKDPIGIFELDSDRVPVHPWWAIEDLNL